MIGLLLAAALFPLPIPDALAPGTVAIILVGTPEPDPVDQPFADAVGQALGEADFTLLQDRSRYIAQVDVLHERSGTVMVRGSRDRASGGIGSFGPAVRVPLGSKKVLRDLVTTTLTVRLLTRDGGQPVWSGRAITVRADGATEPLRLARAVVATYPQTLATPVTIP